MVDNSMNYNISEILKYWISIQQITRPTPNKHPFEWEDTHQTLYDFIPIYSTEVKNIEGNAIHFLLDNEIYRIDNNNNLNEDKENGEIIKDIYPIYCTFISKPAFKRAVEYALYSSRYFSIDYFNLTDRVDLTASYLWFARKSLNKYNIIWLYTLCKQISQNIDKTILKDHISKVSIIEILQKLQEDIIICSEANNIELPEYSNKGSLVLPKGLLFNNSYKSSNIIQSEYDVINLLMHEMMSIKSSHYIVVFRGEAEPLSFICK